MGPILVGIGLLVGCGLTAPPREEQVVVRADDEADPQLCAEHGVLEAVCTRCNPALAPVFQARGDWCAEHELPESFCPICSPEAGGRPPVDDLSVDGAPADGTLLRLPSRQTAARAGLQVVPAEAVAWSQGVTTTARLIWDPTASAQISARSSGWVDTLSVDVGSPVQAGQPLATLRSAHLAGDRSRWQAARTAVDVAEAERQRKQQLLADGVAAPRDVERAERALARARAELAAVQAELASVGGGSADQATVRAPLDGVVAVRHVVVGQGVQPDQPLFEVVDPSRLWARLAVPEAALADVAVGQPVQLVLDALPLLPVQGTLDALAPSIDPATRTATGRVVLHDPDPRLRAEMTGEATVVTDAVQALTVPTAAVQTTDGVHLVFVQQAIDRYVVRRVTVLDRDGDRARVVGGLQAGDPVVTTGSFLLKTETVADRIGAGCCDVEQP
jgi:cobalt-zinc-cadmium efflux system membrane fusion protein